MGNRIQWDYAKIGDLAELTKGRTPSRKHREYYAKEGLPWVKIENLKRKWVSESEEYLSWEGEAAGRTVPEGAILLSVNKTIGKVGIAQVPLQTNEQIISITCRESVRLLPEYLYYYLKFSEKTLQQRAYVTVGSYISMGMLENIIIPVADPEYQEQCVMRLRPIEELLWQKEDMSELLKKYCVAVQSKTAQEAAYDMKALPGYMDQLEGSLKQSLELAQRFLDAVLWQIFGEAEKEKENAYYGGSRRRWLTIDEMDQLDEQIRRLLKEMSLFQQCLYRAFYSAKAPSAIHTILKQVKEQEPFLRDRHIQDALAAVETFRQMGLIARQEDRKLYYTAEETEENEIVGEDGKSLTISLWGCSVPGKVPEQQTGKEKQHETDPLDGKTV